MKTKSIIEIIGAVIAGFFTYYFYSHHETVFALIACIITFVLLFIFCREMFSNTDPYEDQLYGILKTYDSILVEIECFPKISEKKVVKTKYFKDLVNVQFDLRKPIYYFKEDNACDFLIISNDTAYMYTLKKNKETKSKLELYIETKDERILKSYEIVNNFDLDKTNIINEKNVDISNIEINNSSDNKVEQNNEEIKKEEVPNNEEPKQEDALNNEEPKQEEVPNNEEPKQEEVPNNEEPKQEEIPNYEEYYSYNVENEDINSFDSSDDEEYTYEAEEAVAYESPNIEPIVDEAEIKYVNFNPQEENKDEFNDEKGPFEEYNHNNRLFAEHHKIKKNPTQTDKNKEQKDDEIQNLKAPKSLTIEKFELDHVNKKTNKQQYKAYEDTMGELSDDELDQQLEDLLNELNKLDIE